MSFEWIASHQSAKPTTEIPLLSGADIRAIEAATEPVIGQPGLIEQAGLAIARWVLAQAPHAQFFWIACGNGNNGGDGAEAAIHLHRWGKTVYVSAIKSPKNAPADASRAWTRLVAEGIAVHHEAPDSWDVCIDALLGIGLQRHPEPPYAEWIKRINQAAKPTFAIDVPSGLNADTGSTFEPVVQASATLSLVGLKPGLFTHQGRDVCGDIWLHKLGTESTTEHIRCTLNPKPKPLPRPHASHKGSFGDVAIVGGALGMQGAAVLAACAALHAGAGRVFLACLNSEGLQGLGIPPDIMLRSPDTLSHQGLTVVAGCGGGLDISHHLPHWLELVERLVIDADALNAIAIRPALAQALVQRRADTTVITPHPLEAARLLGCKTTQIQANRLDAAQRLAETFQCTVILKGSGSVIAAPGRKPRINPTGNGRLAIGGTGDVLAGLTGTLLSQRSTAWEAASEACYVHGLLADQWPQQTTLTASRLIEHL
jgi:hydroxyethylthiazole kinase-like uncharacterized protein yjeF